MGSPSLFSHCMRFILINVFFRILREAFETRSTGKIVIMQQKLLNISENLNLFVCPGYNL